MKKFFAFAGIFIFILLLAAMFNPWIRPTLENARAMATNDDSSCVYFAESMNKSSFIYGVSKDGAIEYIHREPLPEKGMRASVCQLTFMDNALWFVRAVAENTSGSYSSWELIRLDLEKGAREIMYARSLESSVLPGLSTDGSEIYVTFCAEDGSKAEVFKFIPGEVRSELRLSTSAVPDEGGVFQSALFDGSKLYCSTSDGRVIWFGASLAGASTVLSGGAPTALSISEGNVFFADSKGTLYYSIDGPAIGIAAPAGIGRVRAGVSAGIEGFAVLADTDGGATITWFSGFEFSEPQGLKVTPLQKLVFGLSLLFTPVWWLIVAAVVIILLAGLCLCVRKFFPRIALAYACLALILLAAVIGSTYMTTLERDIARRSADNEAFAASYAESLAALKGRYLGEGRRALAAEALIPRTLGDMASVRVRADLLAFSDETMLVAMSDKLSDGLDFRKGYDSDTIAGIERVLLDGTGVTFIRKETEQRMMVTILPISQGRVLAGALVVTSSMADIYGELDALFGDLAVRAGLITLMMYLLILIVTFLFARPLRLLTRQVSDISSGRYQVADAVEDKSELGDLWRMLQEMCVSLSIDEHKTKSMLSTYYRFVPQGIEKLFGREGIVDIEYGEAETLDGDVGMVTVDNREQFNLMANNNQLMDFANACFNEIYPAAKEQEAVFLSDSFKLSGFQLVFPRSAQDGVRFGLSLMGKKSDEQLYNRQKPEFSMLLHSLGCLYGVIGMEDKAFSFLSSSELDFLSELSPRLSELGIKLALTDQYLAKLGGAFSTRYIGFVSSPGGKHVFKLHEVLDVYPAHERQQRRQYDHRFQEALQLYYKNDFYLARNIFSSLFKESPGDGVAQWYLFACEHFFSVPDLANINYGIFGSEEKAAQEYSRV